MESSWVGGNGGERRRGDGLGCRKEFSHRGDLSCVPGTLGEGDILISWL